MSGREVPSPAIRPLDRLSLPPRFTRGDAPLRIGVSDKYSVVINVRLTHETGAQAGRLLLLLTARIRINIIELRPTVYTVDLSSVEVTRI